MKKHLFLVFALTLMVPWATRAQDCTQTVPYTQDFESFTGTTYNASTGLEMPACWNGFSSSTSTTNVYMPRVVSGTGVYAYYHGSKGFAMTGGTNTTYGMNKYVLLPPMNQPLNQLQLSFWMCTESNSASYGTLIVGYVTSDDTSTFTPIQSYPSSAATQHSGNGAQGTGVGLDVEIVLSSVPANATRLAFKWEHSNTSYHTCCIDDIVVSYPPTCPKVDSISVIPSSDEVVASWTEMGSATTWELTVTSDATVVSTDYVSTNPYTLTGLTANTNYNLAIRAVCGANDTSLVRSIGFRTLCESVDSDSLPWAYGFEDASGSNASATFNPCIQRHTNNSTAYPYPSSSQKHNGNYACYFYSNSSYYSYITLPQFEEDLQNLYLTFWAYKTSANYGHVYVGMMSNPDDLSTFDTLAIFQVSALNTWEFMEVPLASYTGNGRILAILSPVLSSANYVYIDDIAVGYPPACPRPENIVSSNVMSNSANLTWTSSASEFIVEYGLHGFTVGTGDSLTVNTNAVSFENLRMGMTYDVYVTGICGSDTSNYVTGSFTTGCAAITSDNLPYIEDFETYGTGSSLPINACWTKGTNASTAYPYPYSTAAINGVRGLYFYGNYPSSATSTRVYSWAAMPPIEESLNMYDLMVTFNAKRYTTTTSYYNSFICVGIADSVTGFTSAAVIDSLVTWIDTIDLTALPASAIESEEVNFASYTGQGKYVVFYAPVPPLSGSNTYAYNHIYVDDIALRVIPNCFWPTSVSLDAVTANGATVRWIPDARTTDPNFWSVEYGVHGFTPGTGTIEVVSDTTISLDELIPNTEYDIYIRANCGDEESDPAILSFRTLCTPVLTDSLPYIEDFESYASGSANPISPCWYKRAIGTTTAYPYPSTSAASTGSMGLYTYAYGSIYEYAVLPLFDESLENLMLEFDLKRGTSSGTTYHTMVYVGVMSNAEDLSTFDTIAFFDDSDNPTSSITHHRVSFEGYTGSGRIAFLFPAPSTSSHYNYAYLDNVAVDMLPVCRWPLNLTADSVGAYDVDLSWQGSASAYEVQYSTSNDFASASTSSTMASNTSAIISGLTQQTWYYFRVRGICSTDTSFWSNVVKVKTHADCGPNSINIVDTIGHGTSSGYSYAFYGYSSYYQGYTSVIFTAQELADMGIQINNRINGIQLHAGTNSGTINKAKVYIKEVSLNEFGNPVANDTVDRATMTLVYDGTLTTTANTWLEIPFSTPFVYSGNNNLLITLARDTNTSASISPYFFYSSCPGYLTCYGYRSTATTANISVSRTNYRADMVFDICTEIPNCARPGNVTASDVTDNAFTLNWEGSAGSYEVIVSTSSVNPDSVSGTPITVTTNTATITGLNPSTTYYYYVRGICAGIGNSEWSIEGSLTTACSPQSLPYFEDFESYASGAANPISPCWTKGTNISTAYPYPYSTNAVNGQRSLYFYAYQPSSATSTAAYSYAALPMFQDSVKNLSLSFQVRRYATTSDYYTTRLVIGVMTNPSDISTFEPMDTLDLKDEAGSSIHGYEYNFNNYTGTGRYIAIYDAVPPLYGTATYTYSYAYVDDVTVDLIPSCMRPTNVTVSEIGENTAKVHWNSSATNFEVEYGPAGHTAGTGTIVTAAADSTVLSGLTPGSAYDVYVRAHCTATDISQWSFATTFYTECGAISIPYSEDFNVSLADHPCWNGASNATAAQVFAGTALTLTAPTSWTYASAVRDGLEAGHYYKNVYGNAVKSWMITPAIDLSTAASAELSFDVALTDYSNAALPDLNGDTNTSQAFMVIISTDGGNTWQASNAVKWQNVGGDYTYASLASTSYVNKVVDLSAYLGDTIRIAFYCQSLWTGGDNDLHLDNIFIGPASACPRAYDLQAYNGTASSVTLEWTDTIGSTSWVIEYTNESTGTATTVTASSNPFTLTGLSANTLYSYRVAPICSDGQIADWSHSSCFFNTALNPATVPYSYDFENAAEWANWQTASNSNVNWYRGNVAQGNTTNALYLSADNGATHSWNMNTITNAVAYRDIDFGTDVHSYQVDFDAYIGGTIAHNYDGIAIVIADPAIPVESVNTSLVSPWGNVNNVGYGTVRHDTTWGHHTIYIDNISGVKRVAFYHFNQATGSGNSYEDNPTAIDNISITMQLCERPSNIEVVDVFATSVQLRWDGDTTSQYEVCYRVQGQPASTNSYQLVTGLNATINGLTPATDYYWWVRRVCSLTATDTLVSGWVGASSFTTTCVPVSVVDTLFEDFESYSPATYSNATDGVLPNCWDSWNNSSAATPVYPHVTDSGTYSYCVSGRQAVTMTAGSSTGNYGSDSYLRLSDIAEPTNTLTIAFWMCTESSTNGFLEIGYLTGGNYATDFVALKRINASSATYHSGNGIQSAGHGIFDTVSFDSVPAGNFPICFRWNYTSSFYSVCLDDIAVWSSAPACIIPTVTVTDTTDNTVSLSWYGTATDYEVAAVAGTWNNPSAGTPVTGNSYTLTGLTPGTQYAIGVRAVCGDEYYSEWNVMVITTAEHPCYAPTAVTVTDIEYTEATVNWTPAEEGQNDFQVRLSHGGDTSVFTAEGTSYTLTGLVYGTDYAVAVRAVCGVGNESPWSASVPFQTAVCEGVSNVRVSNETVEGATVTWTGTAPAYEVAYGLPGVSQEDCTRQTVTGVTTYTITGLDDATTYVVYVRSVCETGIYSDWSNGVSFTTEIIGIDDVDNANISLYPNPASSTVTLTGIEGEAMVTVVDMNGRQVYTGNTANGSLTIDVSGMAQGAYFVRITGESVNAIRKLIVR